MSADLDALRQVLARFDARLAAAMARAGSDEAPARAALREPPEEVPPGRWNDLALALDLDAAAQDLVLLCLAAESDPRVRSQIAQLRGAPEPCWPDAEIAVALFAADDAQELALRGHLLPGAWLRASGLITEIGADLRLAPPVADWLRGLAYADARLDGIARFGGFERRLPDTALPAEAAAPLTRLAELLAEGTDLPPAVVTATSGTEALLYAEELFAMTGPVALVLELTGDPARDGAAVAAAGLAARLQRVGTVVALPDGAEPRQDHARALRQALPRLPRLVVAAARDAHPAWLLQAVPVLTVDVPSQRPRERAATWRHALAEAGSEDLPKDAALETAADRFAFGPDRILRAAEGAACRAALADRACPDAGDIFAAARALSGDGGDETAQPVRTPYTWRDLILPERLRDRLEDLVGAISHRGRVLDDWGFLHRTGGSRGLAAMFAGPSGTGKTMAASVIAQRLGLELLRVDLAAVVSKYIGETEKNLDRAFEAARRANAILFVDEADAFLGKRSAVRDAHDRYANLEVAYLLQKMESHDGVLILATNLARNLDEAFLRRLHYVIAFPLPDIAGRARLWTQMLAEPAEADRAGIDVAFLARQFELSGGEIRNIVLDAAFRAAREGGGIGFGHVMRAVAHHFEKAGRVLSPADLRDHAALLRPATAAGSA